MILSDLTERVARACQVNAPHIVDLRSDKLSRLVSDRPTDVRDTARAMSEGNGLMSDSPVELKPFAIGAWQFQGQAYSDRQEIQARNRRPTAVLDNNVARISGTQCLLPGLECLIAIELRCYGDCRRCTDSNPA